MEREKEKFAVQGSLQELEDTLMESEAKLHQASENRKKVKVQIVLFIFLCVIYCASVRGEWNGLSDSHGYILTRNIL